MDSDLFSTSQMIAMIWFLAALFAAPPLILLGMLEIEEWSRNAFHLFDKPELHANMV
jgi:hypothetical protein